MIGDNEEIKETDDTDYDNDFNESETSYEDEKSELVYTPMEDVDTVKRSKPWAFKKGNQVAKKDDKTRLKELGAWSITKEIRKRYRNRAKIKKFVTQLENIYYKCEKPEKALAAGIQILERTDGKVKESMIVETKGTHIPDQKEAYEMINMFRIKKKDEEIEGVQYKRVNG